MARPSKVPKTPQMPERDEEPDADDDESGEMEEEDDEELDYEHDGQTRLPLSDIDSDAPSNSSNIQSPDTPSNELDNLATSPSRGTRSHNVPTVEMGAETSREEINDAIRATAVQARGPAPSHKSNGKLTRPTNKSHATQRPLVQPAQARPDTYDVNGLPNETPQVKRGRPRATGPFSPTKKQAKAKQRAQVADEVPEDQQACDAQLLDNENGRQEQQGHSVSNGTRRSPRKHTSSATVLVEDVADDEESATQKATYKSFFPDAAPVHDDQAAAAGQEEQHASRRRPGRPRKDAIRATETSPKQARTAASDRERRSGKDVGSMEAVEGTRVSPRKPASDLRPKPKQSSSRAQRSINAQRSAKEYGPTTAAAAAAQGDVADEAYVDEPEDESDSHDEEDQDDAQDEEDRADPVPWKAVVVRPSEMQLADGDDNQPSEAEEEPLPRQRKRKPKRQQTANTSKKRLTHFETQRAEDEAHHSHANDAEDEENGNRLYGQSSRLQKIFKAPKNIGVSVRGGQSFTNRIENDDEEVKAIVKSCRTACRKLKELKAHSGPLEPDQDPVSSLNDLGSQVDRLYQAAEDHAPDLKDEEKCAEIYFYVFPSLLKVLEAMISCYETLDAGPDSRSPLSVGRLNTVTSFIELIIDLGAGMKDYDRPSSELAVVKPVDDGVVAPLKKVRNAFERALARMYSEDESRRHSQRAARQREVREQREEVQRRQAEQVGIQQKIWIDLHLARVRAETGGLPRFIPDKKRRHLGAPAAMPEFDVNGAQFERISVFTPRVGPSPAAVEEARREFASGQWSEEEIRALHDGLKNHARDDRMYENIFNDHCWCSGSKRGMLNKYNVTQIVTIAADLMEYVKSQQMENRGELEDWMKSVRVWTTGQALGMENLEPESHDVDTDDGLAV